MARGALIVLGVVLGWVTMTACTPRRLSPEKAMAALRPSFQSNYRMFSFILGESVNDAPCAEAKEQVRTYTDNSPRIVLALGWTEWQCRNDRLAIRLTPEGSRQTASWRHETFFDGRTYVGTWVAEQELVDIARIEDAGEGWAEVVYRTRWRANETGRFLATHGLEGLDTPEENQIKFERTSEGWRIYTKPERYNIR